MSEHVIINKPDYILTVDVNPTPRNEMLLTIRRYIDDIGWAKLELYLTDDEYEKFADAVTEHSMINPRNVR